MQLKEMPNLQSKLNVIKLLIDLREKANSKTILGMAIINAIDSKVPDKEVLDFVKEQAIDNPDLMSSVIGSDLCNDILNL